MPILLRGSHLNPTEHRNNISARKKMTRILKIHNKNERKKSLTNELTSYLQSQHRDDVKIQTMYFLYK